MGSLAVVSSFELSDLVDHELISVCFVLNFIEFDFDGPILRCFSDPIVDGDIKISVPGYRDVLCQLIEKSVQRTSDEWDRLVIVFDDGTVVTVPKHLEAAVAEVAHLVPMVDGTLDAASMLVWENLIPSIPDVDIGE